MPDYKYRAETVEAIADAKRIAVLTGAGISAESGIMTFRGKGGIWDKYDFDKLATLEGFLADPPYVWSWYDERRQEMMKRRPNNAHYALADLGRLKPGLTIITQNIDGYHYEAGSRNVLELHGNIWRVRCMKGCPTIEYRQVPLVANPPTCRRCGAMLRPDVVWFGEQLPYDVLEKAVAVSRSCQAMIAVGTSAVVQPAASLPVFAKERGAYVLEVNTEPTPLTTISDDSIFGRAGDILPGLVDRVSGQGGYV